MTATSPNACTREAALEMVEGILGQRLPLAAFAAWVAGYDWDRRTPGADPVLQRALALMELALHNHDLHDAPEDETRSMLQSARDLLTAR